MPWARGGMGGPGHLLLSCPRLRPLDIAIQVPNVVSCVSGRNVLPVPTVTGGRKLPAVGIRVPSTEPMREPLCSGHVPGDGSRDPVSHGEAPLSQMSKPQDERGLLQVSGWRVTELVPPRMAPFTLPFEEGASGAGGPDPGGGRPCAGCRPEQRAGRGPLLVKGEQICLLKALRVTQVARVRAQRGPWSEPPPCPFFWTLWGHDPLWRHLGANGTGTQPTTGVWSEGSSPPLTRSWGPPRRTGPGGRGQPRGQGPRLPALSGTRHPPRAPWEVVHCGAPAGKWDGGLAPHILGEMGKSWGSPSVTFTGAKPPFLQQSGKPRAFEDQSNDRSDTGGPAGTLRGGDLEPSHFASLKTPFLGPSLGRDLGTIYFELALGN